MTLEEMVKRAAGYVEMESVLSCEGVSGAAEAEALFKRLKAEINDAYRLAAKMVKAPAMTEEAETDEYGEIPLSRLTHEALSVRQVMCGRQSCAFQVWSASVIETGRPNAMVRVRYEYLPPVLDAADDEPLIGQSDVPHEFFCYYAASMYWAREGQTGLAVFWDSRWKEIFRLPQGKAPVIMPKRSWR